MENAMISAISGIGVSGLGYFFMYILLKHHLESSNKTMAAIDKLCDKIDELVKSNFRLQQDNNESANQAVLAYSETREHYTKIAGKIDEVKDDTAEIKMVTIRMFDKMGANIQIGRILMQQGVITQEELDNALEEQKKYAV